MKTLYLCRHAKSDWNQDLPDHDRPLNTRGKKSAPVIGTVWKSNAPLPDLWISSSARRARDTAALMINHLRIPVELIIEPNLYHAGIQAWLGVIHQLDQQQDAAALFGHNPGITDVVNYLCDANISNIPTCGLVRIDFYLDDWRLISARTGILVWFEYPRKHM